MIRRRLMIEIVERMIRRPKDGLDRLWSELASSLGIPDEELAWRAPDIYATPPPREPRRAEEVILDLISAIHDDDWPTFAPEFVEHQLVHVLGLRPARARLLLLSAASLAVSKGQRWLADVILAYTSGGRRRFHGRKS